MGLFYIFQFFTLLCFVPILEMVAHILNEKVILNFIIEASWVELSIFGVLTGEVLICCKPYSFLTVKNWPPLL